MGEKGRVDLSEVAGQKSILLKYLAFIVGSGGSLFPTYFCYELRLFELAIDQCHIPVLVDLGTA